MELLTQDAQGTGLQVEALSVRRGEEMLFQGFDCSVQAGQMVWLRGSNGSGKTSLLRVLAGLATPDSGRVTWNGEPVRSCPQFRSQLVYMGHTNALKDDLTAMEALQFLGALQARAWSRPRLEAAMRRMGVHHRRRLPVRSLSQGQRRRLSLCRLALEERAGFWVLDEPLDALDAAGVQLVQELLCDNVRRGGTVLFTSHIPMQADGLGLTELHLPGGAP